MSTSIIPVVKELGGIIFVSGDSLIMNSLEKFYKDLGFFVEGDEYLEDGIPHQKMILYKILKKIVEVL